MSFHDYNEWPYESIGIVILTTVELEVSREVQYSDSKPSEVVFDLLLVPGIQ